MELCEFHGHIYGKYEKQLFIYESLWDSFRPIEKVAWNGYMYKIVDGKYKKDLFDSNYGYGSLEMKALCRRLSNEVELDDAKLITDSTLFWKWCGETTLKWWYDRPCLFETDCISKDQESWKIYLRYLEVKAKTLRRPLKARMTRRHLIAK